MTTPCTGYRIGIDVGGTFTDLVAIDDQGRITTAKSASTPHDQSIGVLDGLELLADALGIDRPTLLGSTERIVHGTTVATNALPERKGAKLGLLTTEGHRDVLEMREGLKDDRYALRQPVPDPLVPRHLRLPVRERIRADGCVATRLGSVFSAWGMLASDLRYEIVRTHIGDAGALDAGRLDSLYREMEAEGRARLAEAAFEGEILCRRSADMRYGEQIFEVEVPLDGVDWSGPDPVAAITDAFHARHEALYTYSLRDQEAVLVNARLAVIGRLPAMPAEPALAPGVPGAPDGARRAWLDGWRELPVHELDALVPGQWIEGPAIVESATTTVLLRSGDSASTTPHGWLDIGIAAA